MLHWDVSPSNSKVIIGHILYSIFDLAQMLWTNVRTFPESLVYEGIRDRRDATVEFLNRY